jgi:pimeloyl-ACP methyl ester carboxylesterase
VSAASLQRLVDRYATWVGDRYACVATPDEISFVECDGWRLAIRRYGRGDPVVLCHGFGGNHASFELDEGRGLAPWLAQRGFAAHVVTLRGTRGSEETRVVEPRTRLDHWACRDVPALVSAVLALSGAHEVAWVGHSLGALLPILGRERRISRLVALGPPLDLQRTTAGSSLRVARWLSNTLTGGRALPMKRLARLEAPLMGRFTWPSALSFVSPPNLQGDVTRALHAHATEDLAGGVLDDLDDWCKGSLTWELRVLESLRGWQPRTVCLVGDEDPWAPPAVIEARAQVLPNAVVRRVCGPDQRAYSHIELLLGQRAASDTFSMVLDALREPAAP